MNKRIKEIAEQCYDERLDGLFYTRHFDQEQFAEMIIKECCQMMIDLESKYPANLTVREIQKHFGIDDIEDDDIEEIWWRSIK